MANKSDLKFYLTVSDINISQDNSSLSIGGYPSTTEFNISKLLSETSDLYSIENIFSSTSDFLLVNSEIIQKQDNTYTRNRLSTLNKVSITGDYYYEANTSFFNNIFLDNKQYRCFAVKNVGSSIFYDLKFYFKYGTLNTDTSFKMSLEIPTTEIITGVADSGTTISLVENSLKGIISNEYDNVALKITSGSNINVSRKIATFDSPTGTFTFLNAFPFPISTGDSYTIENAPSQRLLSGKNQPEVGTIYASEFSNPVSLETAISIDFSETRINGTSLYPNEVVYIWIEREISKNQKAFDNNRIVIACSYRN